MTRIKWFRLGIDVSHLQLVSLLQLRPFEQFRGWGFNVISRSVDEVMVRFIERVLSTEDSVDPYGVSTRIENVRYQSFDFRLFRSKLDRDGFHYLAEVISPPRSLRTLFTSLSEVVEGVSVLEVEVPLLQVADVVRKGSPSAELSRVKVSQLKLTHHSMAKLEIFSSKDALEDFRSVFGRPDVSIDKIRIDRPFGPRSSAIEVGKNGFVSCDEADLEVAEKLMLDLLQ